MGFADQVLDADGKIRRALLSVRGANGKVNLSLSLHSKLFGSVEQMPGVLIHANITSQIVKAAISGKGIIRTCAQICEPNKYQILYYNISNSLEQPSDIKVSNWQAQITWSLTAKEYISVMAVYNELIFMMY
ncbi:hypothetical protein NIES2101_12560 [Calothrix sp. HK-06]|nr:hypothetical protein NIES2101_12560 [Calothrix sp. HK-06]